MNEFMRILKLFCLGFVFVISGSRAEVKNILNIYLVISKYCFSIPQRKKRLEIALKKVCFVVLLPEARLS